LPNYELVYIVSPEVTDEEMPNILNKVSESVTKIGGSVTELVQWGRKRLAYPIKKFGEGNYVFARIEMKPAVTRELEANLKLSNEVIRHLLVRSEA
jgi:small subunit ribosomal protein S6